jgi:hypothetical protein
MRRRFVWDPIAKELVETAVHRSQALHFIQPDLPGYESPIDGKWVEGRKARREDLKRSGCRPYEGREQESKEAAKVRAEAQARMERATNESVERAWAQLAPRKRRVLEGKANGYDP